MFGRLLNTRCSYHAHHKQFPDNKRLSCPFTQPFEAEDNTPQFMLPRKAPLWWRGITRTYHITMCCATLHYNSIVYDAISYLHCTLYHHPFFMQRLIIYKADCSPAVFTAILYVW